MRAHVCVGAGLLALTVLMTTAQVITAQSVFARITNFVVDPPKATCGKSFVIRVTVAYQFPEQTHWLRAVVRDLETEFRKIIVSSEEKEVRKDGSWGFNVPVAAPSSPCRLRLGVYIQFKTATMDWTEFRNEDAWRIIEVEVAPETSSSSTSIWTMTPTTATSVKTITTTQTETPSVVSSRTTDLAQPMTILGMLATMGLLGLFLAFRHFGKRQPKVAKHLPESIGLKEGVKEGAPKTVEPAAETKIEDYERYLSRLEELKAQGRISENIYQKLRKKYAREAVEK